MRIVFGSFFVKIFFGLCHTFFSVLVYNKMYYGGFYVFGESVGVLGGLYG